MRANDLIAMDTLKNEEELQSFLDYCKSELVMTLVLHHIASDVGYVSNKIYGESEVYDGRFGYGLKIRRNNPNSTRYCLVEYCILEEVRE